MPWARSRPASISARIFFFSSASFCLAATALAKDGPAFKVMLILALGTRPGNSAVETSESGGKLGQLFVWKIRDPEIATFFVFVPIISQIPFALSISATVTAVLIARGRNEEYG